MAIKIKESYMKAQIVLMSFHALRKQKIKKRRFGKLNYINNLY